MEYTPAASFYNKELPEYIYHYTSLQILALILENNKIRLNRLDKVNDLQEGRKTALGDISRNVYISCWNAIDDEQIYMWKLYGNNLQGVRLRLRPDFFMFYTLSKKKKQNDIFAYSIRQVLSLGDYFLNPDLNYPLYEIKYVEDIKEYDKNVFKVVGNDVFFDTNLVATYKDNIWSHEKEWRIKVIVIPKGQNSVDSRTVNPIIRIVEGKHPPDEYFDVEMFYPRIDEIEITMGPCMGEGDRILLESLIARNSHKTGFKIKESSLNGKIRI